MTPKTISNGSQQRKKGISNFTRIVKEQLKNHLF